MNTEERPKRETMSLEEATVSNMWEIAAISTRKLTDKNDVSKEVD